MKNDDICSNLSIEISGQNWCFTGGEKMYRHILLSRNGENRIYTAHKDFSGNLANYGRHDFKDI